MSQDARAFNWDSIPSLTAVTADPAAGAVSQALFTVGAGKKRILTAVTATYVCAVAAADRFFRVNYTDGTRTIFNTTHATAMTTGSTYILNTSIGQPASSASVTGVGSYYFFALPNIEVPAAGVVTVYFDNKNAGDDCGVIAYEFKEVPV